jgi:hypothetical protein
MKKHTRPLLDARFPLLLTAGALCLSLPAAARASSVLAAAEAAFERKDYQTALPLLQQLAEDSKDSRAVWLELKKRINVCKDNLKPEEFEKLSWKPGMKRIEPTRDVHAAPKAGEVRSLGIKQLGNFDYDADKGGKIPDDVKALSGTKVRMWGYMIPLRQADKITEFVLVPSLGSCCFGQSPGVQHVITVTTAKGAGTTMSTDPIFVTGKLVVDEQRTDDFTSSIFEIHDAAVEDAGKEIKDPIRGPVRTDPKDSPSK